MIFVIATLCRKYRIPLYITWRALSGRAKLQTAPAQGDMVVVCRKCTTRNVYIQKYYVNENIENPQENPTFRHRNLMSYVQKTFIFKAILMMKMLKNHRKINNFHHGHLVSQV